MIDFSKVRPVVRRTFIYECEECATRIAYTIELPEHMATHGGEWVATGNSCARRCYGRLRLDLALIDESHPVDKS